MSTGSARRAARARMIHCPTSTATPGTLATNANIPYTTATVNPCAAPSPAAPNAHANTPSRGPHPPMLSGSAMATSANSINGSNRVSGAVAPAARAAITNVAR